MYKYLLIIGILGCIASFGYFLLGLMNLEPFWSSAPLFFAAIMFTLHCYNRSFRRDTRRLIDTADMEKEKMS